MDGGQESLVGDVQEGESRRLIDAATLCFDDAVLDLVAHAETVATTDSIRFVHELDLRGELLAVECDRPAFAELDRDVFWCDGDGSVPVRDAHDRLDDVHRGGELFELLGFVRGTPDVGVRRVRLLGGIAIRQLLGGEERTHLRATAHLAHERRVQPGLVDPQARISE